MHFSRSIRFRAQHVALAILLLITALALSSCIHTERGIALNGDGSGTYTLTIGFSEQLVSLASDQIASEMNGFGDKVKQQGGSYRHYDDTGYTYWAYTRPFSSVAQLNQLLQETPAASSSDTSGSPISVPSSSTPTDNFQVTEQAGTFQNTFHISGHMSLVLDLPTDSLPITQPTLDPSTAATATAIATYLPAPVATPPSPFGPSPADLAALLKDMHESFAVTMPGWVTSHTGGTQNGNTVTYLVHYGESTDIDVTGGGYNTALLLPLGIGLLVLLVAAAALVTVLLLRRRSQSALAIPAGAHSGSDWPPAL